MNDDTFKRRIFTLASDGLPYKDISIIITKEYGIQLSSDAIRKRVKRMGHPSRRGQTSFTMDELKIKIQEIITDCPRTTGYRMMTSLLREKGYNVRRDHVMTIMREVDAFGVQQRRRRRLDRRVYRSCGPNHTWHIDGYDKLKPWGLAIHGAIDGFSRKIMWLWVGPSNNDPGIIASYYWKCVNSLKGCPLILQADPGTENVTAGAMQCLFRHSGKDIFAGEGSFRITRSAFNQRIEAWWSTLRRQLSDWWIKFFRDLETFGGITRGNEFDTLCLRSAFIPFIQKELDSFVHQWNSHHIASSRRAICPNGRPDVMFYAPETTGGIDCIQAVSEEDLSWASSQCSQSTVSGSTIFDDFVKESGQPLDNCNNWKDALLQFFHLQSVVQDLLSN